MGKSKNKTTSLATLGTLAMEWVLKNLTFTAFLGFLAVIYIANTHHAEKNIREIQVLQRDLKELRWYYKSLLSENMYNSKQSVVADKVAKEGLRPGSKDSYIIQTEE